MVLPAPGVDEEILSDIDAYVRDAAGARCAEEYEIPLLQMPSVHVRAARILLPGCARHVQAVQLIDSQYSAPLQSRPSPGDEDPHW